MQQPSIHETEVDVVEPRRPLHALHMAAHRRDGGLRLPHRQSERGWSRCGTEAHQPLFLSGRTADRRRSSLERPSAASGQWSAANPVHNRAYRHIVPALGHTRAPHLIDSRAQDLALLLTKAPGTPAKELGLNAAEWRTVHQRAGALCARLHEAGELNRADRVEAEASLNAASDGAEKHLARAGNRLTGDEQQLIRDHAARLRRVGPVPVGFIHGDNQPRNWLFSPAGVALVDFERTRPAACVQDLVILTVTQWLEHPDRRQLFLQSYGRPLTDAEQHALTCLTALDAVNCLAWGPENSDPWVTARGRRTSDLLMRENTL